VLRRLQQQLGSRLRGHSPARSPQGPVRESVATRMMQRLRRRWHRSVLSRPGLRRRVRQRDVDELLRVARLSFVQMQAAWDRADLQALGLMTSAPLMADLREQLLQRGPGGNHTEVLQLEARLLEMADLHEAFVASVEFTGLIREQLDCAAAPFRELWVLANDKRAGQGWQLARVQSLF
jgi:predicted lipid-binding transport protein (Tim44 family)